MSDSRKHTARPSVLPLAMVAVGTMALVWVLASIGRLALELTVLIELALLLVHVLAALVLRKSETSREVPQSPKDAPLSQASTSPDQPSPGPSGSEEILLLARTAQTCLGNLELDVETGISYGQGSSEGLLYAAYQEPARILSGDFVDMVEYLPGRWVFILADISGRGVEVAVPCVELATIFRLEVQKWTRTCGNGTKRQYPELGTFLLKLNDFLADTLPKGDFVTCQLVLFDADTGETRVSGGGTKSLTLIRAEGKSVETLALPDSQPLGLFKNSSLEMSFKTARLFLQPGDSVVLYSNGIADENNPDKDPVPLILQTLASGGELSLAEELGLQFKDMEPDPEHLVCALASWAVLDRRAKPGDTSEPVQVSKKPLVSQVASFLDRCLFGSGDLSALRKELAEKSSEPHDDISVLAFRRVDSQSTS